MDTTLRFLISSLLIFLSMGLQTYAAQSSERPSVPRSIGNPPRPTGEASRGDCPNTSVGINSVVPDNMSLGGHTISQNLTFWIYTPYSLNIEDPETGTINSAVLKLENSEAEEVYQTVISTAVEAPGIVGIPLPNDAPEMKMGEIYIWYVRIFCNTAEPRGVSATAWGWVQRVEPGTFVPGDLWYDRLTEFGTRLQVNPNDSEARSHWNELLEQVDVEGLTDTPVLP